MLKLMDCTLRDGANVVGKGFDAEITKIVLDINHLALQTAWLLAALWVGRITFSFVGSFIPFVATLPSVLRGVFGGAILWGIIRLLKLESYVDLKTIKMVSGFLLEVVVFTAMATLDLEFVSSYIAPVLIYSVVMVAVTIPAILFTAKRFCHHEWFEKAVMRQRATLPLVWHWFARWTLIPSPPQAIPTVFILP